MGSHTPAPTKRPGTAVLELPVGRADPRVAPRPPARHPECNGDLAEAVMDEPEVDMITEKLPRLDDESPWEDGIEPELELPLGELPSIIIDEAA
jgi:hypothetical protein